MQRSGSVSSSNVLYMILYPLVQRKSCENNEKLNLLYNHANIQRQPHSNSKVKRPSEEALHNDLYLADLAIMGIISITNRHDVFRALYAMFNACVSLLPLCTPSSHA